MVKVYLEEANIIKNNLVVPVYVDTEGESVNAYEIKIKFSNNLIFRDWNDAGSVINFWLEKPNIQNDTLQFSGVSIGGYIGKKGLLVNLIFEPKENRVSFQVLPSSKILLNDGQGTEAKLKTETKFFAIKELKPLKIIEDKFPPEPFKIYLVKEKEILNNKYHIIFQTTDKQSGIAYYEVAEKQSLIKPKLEDLKFEKSEPPYLLKDQTLRSYIFVKAVDKFGNQRIEYLKSQKLLNFDEILNFLFFLMIIFLLIRLFKNRKINRK